MTARCWVGIDPGGSHTGFVIRDDDGLCHWHTVIDHDPDPMIAVHQLADGVAAASLRLDYWSGPDPVWAIEDLTPPKGRVGGVKVPINPGTLIGTGRALGALLNAVWTITGITPVLVKPDKHGKRALNTYPPDLIPPLGAKSATRRNAWAEMAGQSSQIRHARSAWDVAGSAIAAAGLFEVAR